MERKELIKEIYKKGLNTFIIGGRNSGKTSLLGEIYDHLENNSEDIIYLDTTVEEGLKSLPNQRNIQCIELMDTEGVANLPFEEEVLFLDISYNLERYLNFNEKKSYKNHKEVLERLFQEINELSGRYVLCDEVYVPAVSEKNTYYATYHKRNDLNNALFDLLVEMDDCKIMDVELL